MPVTGTPPTSSGTPPTAAASLSVLLDLQRVLAQDLPLLEVLDRVVLTACSLVSARCGALVVLDAHGFVAYEARFGADDPLDDARSTSVDVVACGELLGRLVVADPITGRFGSGDDDVLSALAASAGAAIDHARLHDLEVRHGVARDLHDNVMQRLFATGVGLQSVAARDLPDGLSERLGHYIDDLDATIEEIRGRVFNPYEPGHRDSGSAAARFPQVTRCSPDARPSPAARLGSGRAGSE